MLKKLLVVVCATSLLTACSTRRSGAEIYGANGGWKEGIDVENLEKTQLTKAFAKETTPIVYFAFNSSELSAEAKESLTGQAEFLKNNPEALIVVAGNCDERGTEEYNLALGKRRAVAVENFLKAHGVKSIRIKVISYGKERPIATGSSEEAYAKNRNAQTTAY